MALTQIDWSNGHSEAVCSACLLKLASSVELFAGKLSAANPNVATCNNCGADNVREPQGQIWVCRDCMLALEQGEISEDIEEGCVPWSLGGGQWDVTKGLLWADHVCGRNDDNHRETECDCETNTFATSPCGGVRYRLSGRASRLHLLGLGPSTHPPQTNHSKGSSHDLR